LENSKRKFEKFSVDYREDESTMANMTEGVIMLDEHGDIVVFNPRAKELLGISGSEPAGTQKIKTTLEDFGIVRLMKKSRNENRQIIEEVISPSECVLRYNVNPVFDSKGNTIGVVSILRDITKEKEIDRMKTEFISTVSHELRTPLSITREGISLILDEIPGKINSKQRDILTSAMANADRLARIINELLDISKIEAGKIGLKNKMVDAVEIIRRAADAFKPAAKKKGVQIIVSVPQKHLDIYADPGRMFQVFTNLLDNALKFTDAGSVKIKGEHKKDCVEFSVQDTGIGIARADLPGVFSKFQQFGRTDGPGDKGTGLGLAIIKHIIEMHKGEIRVESKLGKGTRFIFTLPPYRPADLFRKRIENAIRIASGKNREMSVIVVSISNFETEKKRLTEDTLRKILRNFEQVLHENLRKKGDTVIKDTGDIVIILEECDKENALFVQARLEKALRKHLRDSGNTQRIEFKMGCATYPNEGQSDEELFQKAKKI
jgi:PAS domain S-box-containing protein/diguanylate cyclase (GGDEF)-like protein